MTEGNKNPVAPREHDGSQGNGLQGTGNFRPHPAGSFIFIPSALDEYGLTAQQFRVFCHIARRGACFSSGGTIAKICRLHEDTVWTCLNELERLGMVKRSRKHGATSEFTITPPTEWNPPETEGQPHRKARGDTRRKARGDYPPETEGCKGSPSEGSPMKGMPAPIRTVMDAKDVISACDERLNALRNRNGDMTPDEKAEWEKLVERKREAQAVKTGVRPTRAFAEKKPDTLQRNGGPSVDRNRGSLNEGKSSQYADIGKVSLPIEPEPAVSSNPKATEQFKAQIAALKAEVQNVCPPTTGRRGRA